MKRTRPTRAKERPGRKPAVHGGPIRLWIRLTLPGVGNTNLLDENFELANGYAEPGMQGLRFTP